MMDLLNGILSTAAFISLCVYIYLAVNGKSLTLYSTVRYFHIAWWKKLFLALAVIAFLVCMFKGSEALLWWFPRSWGVHDDDGEFTAMIYLLPTVFSIIGGLSFVNFINNATHEKIMLKNEKRRADELDNILELSDSLWKLKTLKDTFLNEASSLNKQFPDDSNPLYKDIAWDVARARISELKRSIYLIDQLELRTSVLGKSQSSL